MFVRVCLAEVVDPISEAAKALKGLLREMLVDRSWFVLNAVGHIGTCLKAS